MDVRNMKPLDANIVIAFDGDDTLWHNESLYEAGQVEFEALLAARAEPSLVRARLLETESRNLELYGYGVKGFVLSMLETYLDLSEGRPEENALRRILEIGKGMLENETQVLDGVETVLSELQGQYPLMIITKGDLLDQENKIARSRLAGYFTYVEIISQKTPESYRAILQKYGLLPEQFIMVGNSLRSDAIPVLEIGGTAVHIPYHLTWVHEEAGERPLPAGRLFELDRISGLPRLVSALRADGFH